MVLCFKKGLLAVFLTAAAPAYHTSGVCAGYPAVSLKTAPGLCVGLVATGLGFPRGVAAIADDWFVADMGGWRHNHGRVLRLGHDGHDAPVVLLDGLDEPNALARAPGGALYVGVRGRVLRFDPSAADPKKTVAIVLDGLPGDGRHPLAAMAVASDGSLFVNVGSASDNCVGDDGHAPLPCPETRTEPPHGSILHVTPAASPVQAARLAPYATGLRNSMALAVLPDEQLVAAVNARDAIDQADPTLSDALLPHDTMDWVVAGADYGWPYCFDEGRASPESHGFDCTMKQSPTLRLPPHAAPLGLLLYHGTLLPGQDGHLLLPYHGYRAAGHRLMSVALSAEGKPVGEPQEVIGGWDPVAGNHPRGAPTGIAAAADGSVLITEDVNGTLLRLAR